MACSDCTMVFDGDRARHGPGCPSAEPRGIEAHDYEPVVWRCRKCGDETTYDPMEHVHDHVCAGSDNSV